MTYKLASSIRRMVEHMSETWLNDPYVCACVNEAGGKDNWECHFFLRKGERRFNGELWAIALGIQKASCGIILCESHYNRGIINPEYVETICLK